MDVLVVAATHQEIAVCIGSGFDSTMGGYGLANQGRLIALDGGQIYTVVLVLRGLCAI